MDTHTEILDALGLAAVAQALSVPLDRVYKWRQRDSIPAGYWAALVAYAASQDVRVSLEALAHGAQERAS